MRRSLWVLVLALLWGPAGWAAPLELWRVPAVVQALGAGSCLTLPVLLAACQREHPAAVVTSGFRDVRGVSRYRRTPGLHLGYDIAMPAGTRVPCAAAGEVVAVIPWTEVEWGVTVRHGDGSEATYGHLVCPEVTVGQRVDPGQVLGAVAVDHLDVKVRDVQGMPLELGAASQPGAGLAGMWIQARSAVAEAQQHRAALDAEMRALQAVVVHAQPGVDQDGLRLRAGLISVKEARRRREHRAACLRERDRCRLRLVACAEERERARDELRSAVRRLHEVERQARAVGLQWDAVDRLIRQRLAQDARLRAAVVRAGQELAARSRRAAAEGAWSRGTDLRRMATLYRLGAISRRGYEQATGRMAPSAAMRVGSSAEDRRPAPPASQGLRGEEAAGLSPHDGAAGSWRALRQEQK